RRDAGRSLHADLPEGVDDTEHGSQQPDERGDVPGRGEKRQVCLRPADLFLDRVRQDSLYGALGRQSRLALTHPFDRQPRARIPVPAELIAPGDFSEDRGRRTVSVQVQITGSREWRLVAPVGFQETQVRGFLT